MLGEVPEIELGRLARGIAEDHDRTAMVDALDRGFQGGAAGAFEDQREAALGVLDTGDDLGGAKSVEHAGALGPADDRGDPSAGAGGKLHGEIADPAGGPSDQ